ncbi:DUF6602 domain-containing protein [Planctomycetota bacterium]
MNRTIIQKYTSSVVRDFIERAKDLRNLKKELNLTKGEIKELFVARVLKSFLSSQFDIGSGIIINCRNPEKHSNQTDIIIYDNRILPPFIKEQNIGVYPIESVIATVEIKTKLDGGELKSAEEAAQRLCDDIFKLEYGFKPLCAIFGFEGGVENLTELQKGKNWLNENIKFLSNICIAEKYCWANSREKGWCPEFHHKENKTYNETKRFIALLVDNIRTASQKRFAALINPHTHQDWFSLYIRD